jgi:hypothetical protein
MQNSLKSGGTKDHLRWVKVPGAASYWKALLVRGCSYFLWFKKTTNICHLFWSVNRNNKVQRSMEPNDIRISN